MKYRYRIILNNIQNGDYYIDKYVSGRIIHKILTSQNEELFDIRLRNNAILRVTYFKNTNTILRML